MNLKTEVISKIYLSDVHTIINLHTKLKLVKKSTTYLKRH
jgi:hypothetical protein